MWRILFAQVKAVHSQLSFDNVVWVGADEINRPKGHNYLTVFTDPVAKRVLVAKPGKYAPVWEAFTAESQEHNGRPKAIQNWPIDISAVAAKGVSGNLGNVQVVRAKFHVIQNVVKAFDQVRQMEGRNDALKRDRVDQARWMRLKNRVNRTEK